MSPPISSSVKEKVIQLHLDGKGRNEIAEVLNHSHIRISQGSVTNILNAWKREQGNSDTSQPVASPEAVLSKVTPQASPPPSSSPDNNMGSSFPNRVANPTTTSQPVQENPLDIHLHSHPSTPELSQIPQGLPPENAHVPALKAQVQMPEVQASEVQGVTEVQDQSSEVQAPSPNPEPESPTMDFCEGSVSGWPSILREIRHAKQQRRHELLLIDRRRKKLEQWKKWIDREKYELAIREARVLDVEPFLPVARRLQDLSIGLDEAIPWIETIQEVAQNEKIDSRTAAYRIAQELRSYRQFGGLQKSIQQIQQRLAILTMLAMQKERALMVLMELENRGVSLDEIYGLSKIIDLDKLGKEWHYDMGKNMNDSGSNGGSNGYGLKDFKLDSKLNCAEYLHRNKFDG
jgi:hypothetical protein